ncbi:hypothetical protein, conserved [Babesia ovata]|uniref:Uncharacterized protein n=1 Tax=Babesia ovata TaxID=189622 RepID=A0A2H6KFW1_9APIC|nr:uncharacterized protein BOVATA_033740 [Babesia ovata]GBE61881.1 hypothetical protein, conserved [Babesia ovata]
MRNCIFAVLDAALLLLWAASCLGRLPPGVLAINRPNAVATLGSEAATPKNTEVEHVEEAEIGQSQGVHSLDDEIRNHEMLDLGRQEDFYLPKNGGGCDVLLDDVIYVALEPRDMLKTQQFVGSITPSELRLYIPDRKKTNADAKKLGKLFARFSLGAIVTPLETLRSSRDCFRMFYKSDPILFCARDTSHRDFWMHALLKAKFCHTAHTVLGKGAAPEVAAGPAELPDLSTKAQRLYDLLHPKSSTEEAAVAAHRDSKITNIDITNINSGEPQIYLNGEEVKSEEPPKEQEALLKEQSERSQNDGL